jgi:exopolyphosphatase/pppGpp-phosphohydrolase
MIYSWRSEKPSSFRALREGTAADPALNAVLRLAESCHYERAHTHQVKRCALRLFDELQPLHRLGNRERFWLECGAILHDIGKSNGSRKHHKTALRIILESPLLPFDMTTRRIIGCIARYHTKAVPSRRHFHFAALDESESRLVLRLAAMLRAADALDRGHRMLVDDLRCRVTQRQLYVRLKLHGEKSAQTVLVKRILRKGELLERVFHRRLVVEAETQNAFLAARVASSGERLVAVRHPARFMS